MSMSEWSTAVDPGPYTDPILSVPHYSKQIKRLVAAFEELHNAGISKFVIEADAFSNGDMLLIPCRLGPTGLIPAGEARIIKRN